MPDLTCDVAIIGAGTAGLAAERSARRAGATTLLIDDRFAGTTCTTVGCMPSKLLIAAAEAAQAVRRAPVFGIRAAPPAIDGPAVMQRLRQMRDSFIAATKGAFDTLPQGTMIQARARFSSPATLSLHDGRTISARATIIATGARPSIPPMFKDFSAHVLTNETIFDLPTLPASLAVIGAGPLGLELAQALARLGVRTAVFDKGQTLGGIRDSAIATTLQALLERDLPIRLGVELTATPGGDGVRLSWRGQHTGNDTFAHLLVATGRPPQLAGLGLEHTGLPLDDHGTPRFDPATLQCGDAPIFIAGDADAAVPVLHEASSEGAIAGRNAAAWPHVTPSRRNVPFSLMFTDPPVAILGDTGGGTDAVIGCASYQDQGRARVMAQNAGMLRLYAERTTGGLIGAAMATPGTDHMAHLIAWAIEHRQSASDLLGLPFYHPTLEEGLRPALRDICRQVDPFLPAGHDEDSPPGA